MSDEHGSFNARRREQLRNDAPKIPHHEQIAIAAELIGVSAINALRRGVDPLLLRSVLDEAIEAYENNSKKG